MRFANTYGDEKAILYNNGIVEYLLPLESFISSGREQLYFNQTGVWGVIEHVSQGYQAVMTELYGGQRYFGCVSIVGCKGIASEGHELRRFETVIDRNQIVCETIVFTKMEEETVFYLDLKRLHLEYLLSLGIKESLQVTSLFNEITASKE